MRQKSPTGIPILNTVLFHFLLTSSPVATAQEKWKEVETMTDTATPIAERIAAKIAPKLITEGTKVIFLDYSKCIVLEYKKPSTKKQTPEQKTAMEEEIERYHDANESWCNNFQSSIEAALISKGIKFLGESERNVIRKKIAEEQGYQSSSMQVDVTKAVELGRQRAFQSFVSINITPDAKSRIIVTASSIDIKEGVVNLTEKIKASYDTKSNWTTSQLVAGSMLIGLGLPIGAYGQINGDKESRLSDEKFKIYKSAATPEDATQARKVVDDHDKKAAQYHGIGAAGWAMTISGILYLWISNNRTVLYRLETSNQYPTQNKESEKILAWQPFLTKSGGIGISFGLNLSE